MKRRNNPYLRALRLRSALTQNEVAFLLGTFDRTHVSRHESGERRPVLADYLAYELIFGVRLAAAFDNDHSNVARRMWKRAKVLHESLGHRTRDPLRNEKRAALELIIKRCTNPQK